MNVNYNSILFTALTVHASAASCILNEMHYNIAATAANYQHTAWTSIIIQSSIQMAAATLVINHHCTQLLVTEASFHISLLTVNIKYNKLQQWHWAQPLSKSCSSACSEQTYVDACHWLKWQTTCSMQWSRSSRTSLRELAQQVSKETSNDRQLLIAQLKS